MEVSPEIFAWLSSLDIINPFNPNNNSDDKTFNFIIPEKICQLLFGGKYMDLILKNKKIRLHICTSFKDRFIGLMFKKCFTDGYLFPHCNSIHTFFMKEPIDVIFLDNNNVVTNVIPNLKPWKIILPKKNVYSILELPINHSKYYKINEKIKISN